MTNLKKILKDAKKSENPADLTEKWIHEKKTSINLILQSLKDIELLILIGKHLSCCKNQKCYIICEEMNKKQIIPEIILKELVLKAENDESLGDVYIGGYALNQLPKIDSSFK